MNEMNEVVASFLDGEPVDPERLIQALAEPEGRAYLVDLLVLRGVVRADATVRGTRQVSTAVPRRARWLTVAAALGLAGTALGYVAGVRVGEDERPAGEPSAIRSSAANPAVSAPQPTSVIYLEPGIDWSERQ